MEKVKINIEMTKDERAKLKVLAIKSGMTLKTLLYEMVKEGYLKRSKSC